MSESTLEKFIAHGFIRSYADLFRLNEHRDEIVAMEGFGEKSYDNIIAAAKKASNTTADRLLYALGIPGIGSAGAKLIAEHFDFDMDRIRNATQEELTAIDGIGDVMASAYINWWRDESHIREVDALLDEVHLEAAAKKEIKEAVAGKTFVITGGLEHFENRDALKAFIENAGGKVTGSVSAKTDYLINNDKTSLSSKNKKAAQLGIPVISEEDFIKMAE